MLNAKIGRKLKNSWCLTGFLFLMVLLGACGYPSPTPGGGLTPYVVVVTPTPLSSTITAAVANNSTPTPSATPTSKPSVSAAATSGPSTPAGAKPTPSL